MNHCGKDEPLTNKLTDFFFFYVTQYKITGFFSTYNSSSYFQTKMFFTHLHVLDIVVLVHFLTITNSSSFLRYHKILMGYYTELACRVRVMIVNDVPPFIFV